jgi:hypothetical protein
MRLSVIFLAAFSVVLANCTYSTHQEVFTEVSVGDAELPFVLLNFSEDPINIKEETELVFQLQNDRSNQGFVEYTFTLNGQSYTRTGDGEKIARYYISPANYQDGQTMHLSFEGIVKSGTRSLASRLDAEFVIIAGAWDIKIHAKKPSKIQPSVGIESGSLKIGWEPLNLEYNHKYILNIEKTSLNGNRYESIEFKSGDDLQYCDLYFNGVRRNYWIDIVSNWYTITGDTVAFELDPINIDYYALGHSHVVVKWETIPFYNHDLGFIFQYDKHTIRDLSLLGDSTIIYYPDFLKDSTLTLNAVLGWYVSDQKTYEKIYHINNPSNNLFDDRLKVGFEYDSFDKLMYSTLLDRILLIGRDFEGNYLYQINPGTREIEVKKEVGIAEYQLPQGSEYLYEIVHNNSSAARISTLDLRNNYTSFPIDIEHLSPPANMWCTGNIHSLAGEKMIYQSICKVDNGNASRIYNHRTGKIELIDSLGALVLSPSGKFAYSPVTNDLLRFDGVQWSHFSQINLQISWDNTRFWIYKNGKEQIYIFQEENVQLYEWHQSLQSSPPINPALTHQFSDVIHSPYVDYVSGLIGGDIIKNELYKNHVIIQLEERRVLGEVELELGIIAKLIGNTLYLSNGMLIDELL